MFKFTFSFGGDTVYNPFAAQAEERNRMRQAVAPQTVKWRLPAPRRPPQPSIAEEALHSKKRGWAPAGSSASDPISQPTVTTGWIDTPAKYLAQASVSRGGVEEEPDVVQPPAKRRRTLTDSIISTAFSAALIGTAVGMTAYRMWRDRGRSAEEPASFEMEAPPPYQKEEWVDDEQPPQDQPSVRSPKFNKKPRPIARRTARHRRSHAAMSPPCLPSQVFSRPDVGSSSHEEPRGDQGELENHMDMMSVKIRQLIEDGQKALGKEIVITTDDPNDEDGATDDGMDGWEEDTQGSVAGRSFTRSSRQKPSN